MGGDEQVIGADHRAARLQVCPDLGTVSGHRLGQGDQYRDAKAASARRNDLQSHVSGRVRGFSAQKDAVERERCHWGFKSPAPTSGTCNCALARRKDSALMGPDPEWVESKRT